MTFDEFRAGSHQISTKVREFRTVTVLLELSLQQTGGIDDRAARLPEIEDICDVLCILAQQADEFTEKLFWELPYNAKGFKS